MLDAPEQEHPAAEQPQRRLARFEWLHTLQASSTRRALLLTALGGLLIAGVVTVVPIGGSRPGRLAGYVDPVPSTGTKGNEAFNHATSGNCLMWPDRMPEAATIVDCKDEHRFEVAESVDMRTFPGSEYGPDAARRRPRASNRSARSSAKRRCAATSAPGSTPTASSASACSGRVTGRGDSPANAACCAACNCPARTTSRSRSKARSPTSTSPRCGRPAPAWASTCRPTSQTTSRSTAPRRMPWR
ncbi:hypothetical protein I552_8506 [Mycobacterium xenopi 3993]|nr:hypothetical protein I552_8506 [Mycobacterium xenopi 3993]